ncbi:hypothetical protein WN944_019642 [Citrus x changshan-huyou]|uniref:Uncharacterized protein n=1 Tax=Citrus x changshan-huyou TaxID=2935761 RepID=A0AAP0QJN2_9ROSI
MEKTTINRIFLILHSRKEEREIPFPFPFRRDQKIGSSLRQVVSCLPMDLAAVRKVDLFGNLRIYAYFQLPEAFRRLLRSSSSLVHELEISGLEPLTSTTGILVVPEDPTTGEPGTESFPLFPPPLFGLKNAGFYGRSATPGYRRRPWGDLVVSTGWRRWGIPDEGTLREPPTPTTAHVRSILDLINRPSYLFYVLDSPSLF